jgi:alkylation response protein AidB-like acyl-CoA dehydrogenase
VDVLLNDEERTIKNAAREFLEGESPTSLVREMEKDALGYSPKLWAKMADLGWLGLSLPSEYGGQEMPLTFTGLLLQEIGRHISPVPFHSTVVASLILAKYGTAEQKAHYLPGICDGRQIATYALQEAAGSIALPDGIALTAVREGDEFVLNGTKSFVDNSAVADWLLVVCRGADGLIVLVVDGASAGINATPLVTTAKDLQGKLRFDGVRVPVTQQLGTDGALVARDLLDLAAVLLCAQMVGATRKDMELAVEYSKQRFAFGRAIGSFQSIQHLCADMLIWTDGAELLTSEAIWRLSEGLPASVEVSQAKAFSNDKCLAVCRSSQQIHGGIGFMMEFDLQLWYRRVVAWGLRLGSTGEHRARVARAVLDGKGDVRLGMPLELPV